MSSNNMCYPKVVDNTENKLFRLDELFEHADAVYFNDTYTTQDKQRKSVDYCHTIKDYNTGFVINSTTPLDLSVYVSYMRDQKNRELKEAKKTQVYWPSFNTSKFQYSITFVTNHLYLRIPLIRAKGCTFATAKAITYGKATPMEIATYTPVDINEVIKYFCSDGKEGTLPGYTEQPPNEIEDITDSITDIYSELEDIRALIFDATVDDTEAKESIEALKKLDEGTRARVSDLQELVGKQDEVITALEDKVQKLEACVEELKKVAAPDAHWYREHGHEQ